VPYGDPHSSDVEKAVLFISQKYVPFESKGDLVTKLQAVLVISAFTFAVTVKQSLSQQPTQAIPTSPQSQQEAPSTQSPKTQSSNNPLSDMLSSHLPAWLNLSGEVRLRSAGVLGDFFRDSDDSYLLTRTRINMKLTASSWLKFYFQGQDSHIVGASQTSSLPPLQQDAMDLRLGFVELGDVENKKFRMRLGRQELAFGEERLIGPANWLNTPRSFDAASMAIRTDGFRVDVFAASVVKIHDGQFNENTPGNHIYGLYSVFSKLVPKGSLEPYFFWRRQSGLTTETKKVSISNFGTIGFRLLGKLPQYLDYNVEMAQQKGSLGTDNIIAWAGHWLIGHSFPAVRFTPHIFAEYNYASGDHNPTDGKRGTFDQLFPSAHDLYGLTDQVGWKNIHHARGGLEIKARIKWSLAAKYNSYWLADAHDALYNSASTPIAKSITGGAGRFVGQELDFITSYKLNSWTTFAGGFSHLFSGTFLKITTPAAGYSYPYASLLYTF
jgi:hypothetical protein